MEQRQTFISLSLDGERVRESQRESFDALKMIITISKSASEENVPPPHHTPLPPPPPPPQPPPPPLPLCPVPSCFAPYHLIQLHNECLGQGGLWVCVTEKDRGQGANSDTSKITHWTNTKMRRKKMNSLSKIRGLLWIHKELNLCKYPILHRWSKKVHSWIAAYAVLKRDLNLS